MYRINVDDYGMESGVTNASIELFILKKINSVSLMIYGNDVNNAINKAKENDIPCGLHFDITSYYLPQDNFFSQFRNNTCNNGKDEILKIIENNYIEIFINVQTELRKQISEFALSGLTLHHIDSHHNILESICDYFSNENEFIYYIRSIIKEVYNENNLTINEDSVLIRVPSNRISYNARYKKNHKINENIKELYVHISNTDFNHEYDKMNLIRYEEYKSLKEVDLFLCDNEIVYPHIKHIDIQLYNICNKRCWFCPPYTIIDDNNIIDYLNIDKLIEFIEDGVSNGYISKNTHVCINRLTEPLIHIELTIEAINKIRNSKLLKDFKITICTNGDFIKKINETNIDIFKKINTLHINLYDIKQNENFNTDVINFLENYCNIDISKLNKVHNNAYEYHIKNEEYDFRIHIVKDVEEYLKSTNLLVSRGSLVKEITDIRKHKCSFPLNMIGIDSNGNIMPCGQLYSKMNAHKKYKISNIYEDSSFANLIKKIINKGIYYEEHCVNCLRENWVK